MDESKLSEDEARKLAALGQALIDAEESGPSEPLDVEQFLAEMQQRHKLER